VNADEANHTARAHARARTRQLQRALYRAAKASPTRRFHALYDKISDPDILQSAWEAVRANRGAPGIDGETIQARTGSGRSARRTTRWSESGTSRITGMSGWSMRISRTVSG
jgi:hypothetical protein